MGDARELADVCIVGAGIAGAILAYELGRRGIRVVVLEAGSK
jgi:flavin-dependent dehydrogenase